MRIPDVAQRTRALDPAKSFIVQAPAGSGKTELLIQRYLTLLARVEQPEAVLAITFTKKAAGEMRQRVIAALRQAAGPRPAREHEALTWELARAVRARSDELGWELFSNPSRLQIRTIDSLCASIIRQMPWMSRLGAPPAIVEDATELYSDAARRTIELLETGEWSDAVEALLSHLDNDFAKLQKLLADLLARRDQWLRHVAGAVDAGAARDALESALQNAIRDGVEKARSLMPEEHVPEIVAVASLAGRNLLAAGRDGAATACDGMDCLPDADDLDSWLGIVETLLTKENDWRRKPTVANGCPPRSEAKQRAEDLLAALGPCEPLRAALADLRLLPEPRFSEPQWRALRAVVELLPMAAAQLQVRFRSGGETDYSEVALAAQHALGDSEAPTDLALSLDHRIQHLLVDEFQDTSVSQYSLVAKLTTGWEPGDGRTLFLVGDPMQSIYRFREAEVGLFLKASREGIGGVPLELLRLTANFRSDGGVVAWVNDTFPAVLPPNEDIATGAIPFSPSVAVKGDAPQPAVTLHPFVGRDDIAEAARVADVARGAHERGAKVAILVRARSHLTEIIPALRAAGLRFRAVEIDSLAALPVIRDLASLTRALLHPGDRVAWLSVLRAPWCGLSLADLHALCADLGQLPIWDAISDEARVARLDAAARARLQRFAQAVGPAVSARATTLRAWVEGAWLALGGPACDAGPAGRENAAAFFDLLERMDDGAPLDPVALAGRIEDLYARPDPEADDGVQVMSIHKAKGLEFDVVIVPGLGRKARNDETRLLLWLERPRLAGDADLLMAPIQATGAEPDRTYDFLKRINALKAQHEAGRLLYVAATRAKSQLHLLGHAELNADTGELKPPDGSSLLKRMWDVAKPQFEAAAAVAVEIAEPGPAPERTPLAIERLSLEWTRPAPPPALSLPESAPPVESAGETRVTFEWVGDTLRHVGTVVHQMLRRVAEDGASGWDALKIAHCRPAFRAALLTLGVPAKDVAAAVESVAGALTRTLEDERGVWLLRGGAATACEYSLAGVVSGEVVHARIDRTFIDDEGVRWIVDYKSSTHQGAGLDAFLDAERERYSPQLLRYRRLFAALEDRPIRAALYFPLLGGWREIDTAASHAGGDAA